MPVANFTKTYADGQPLFELDLDNLRESVEEFVNVTQLDYQNIQAAGLNDSSFDDPGIFARPGSVVNFAGSAAPAGWLLCNGASVLAASYPNLFAAIGYTYGGAGANFTLPNLQGRVSMAKDNLGGTPANRVTAGVAGADPTVLGTAIGNQNLPQHDHDATTVLTTAGEGGHTHTYSGSHTHDGNLPFGTPPGPVDKGGIDGGATNLPNGRSGNYEYVPTGRATYPAASTGVTIPASSGSHTHTVGGGFSVANNTDGASSATGVVQPTFILNKIIKT